CPPPAPPATSCPDGNPCHQRYCDPSGNCQNPPVPNGQPCQTVPGAQCNACQDGVCVASSLTDGTSCNLFGPCPSGTCHGGSCVPNDGVPCLVYANPICQRNLCQGGSCVPSPLPDGTGCACGGQCEAGQCVTPACNSATDECHVSGICCAALDQCFFG